MLPLSLCGCLSLSQEMVPNNTKARWAIVVLQRRVVDCDISPTSSFVQASRSWLDSRWKRAVTGAAHQVIRGASAAVRITLSAIAAGIRLRLPYREDIPEDPLQQLTGCQAAFHA